MNARTLRVALLTVLSSLPAATALAQTGAETTGTDSPMLIMLAAVFCLLIVGLLARTAYHQAHLD